jgi:hypothetical protein
MVTRSYEISSEVVELFIFCETQEGLPGQILTYIHQPEGISYTWCTIDHHEQMTVMHKFIYR